MATLGSRFLTRTTEWNANFTDHNHLGRLMQLKPHVMMDKVSTLFSARSYYSNNPLSSVLKNIMGAEVYINGTEWEWQLRGATTRPLMIKENVEVGNKKVGQFQSPFRIKLDENWYKTTDVITPGTSNKKYNCVIIDGPVRQGDGYVYTAKLITQNSQDFIPENLLAPGKTWRKLYSISGEAAEKGGSTQFSSPLTFRNKLSKFRKEYKITDYASTAVLEAGIPDGKGKIVKTWMRYADAEFMRQWYEELEQARWYGRSGQVYQDNGRPYETSPGIQEQLEDSHIHRYTHLTVTLIEEYLMDIFYGRTAPGKNGRNVVGFTGEFGMLEFSRAMNDWMRKNGTIRLMRDVTKPVNSEYHGNAYSVGMQYTEYQLSNGGKLTLVHNPLYDNINIHDEMDPITGKPLESMRITFLDLCGESASEPNIKVTKKNGGDFFNYIIGNYGPYGPQQRATNSAHAGDYYEMHIGAHEGIHIKDVTKCGELICSRN